MQKILVRILLEKLVLTIGAHSILQNPNIFIQKYELIKNIEKLSFWSSDNQKLHFDKRELLAQINNLNISISGNGFFKVDRQFLARVSVFVHHL